METKQKVGTKEKRRNNEKRKEKSRDAARYRRSKETEIFGDLAGSVPVTQEQISQLDKASIMRLAISYLRVREMVSLIPGLHERKEDAITDDSHFLKSLEGFVLVLSGDGDIVYLTENVSDYLGIGQIDLMGQNIYEYSHPCDHDEIKELLSGKSKEEGVNLQKSFFIRLKCTLTSKGRSVNLKSASYKVLKCEGHMLKADANGGDIQTKLKSCFVAIATPIPHPSNIETPLPKKTFITKHSLDMKFIHADDEIMKEVLGYNEEELLSKSLFEYHHAMDSDAICGAYKCLFSKGQCETSKYRFLAKNGGYVWVSTQATLIYDKMQKPQSVVCVNYVISGLECENEVYSAAQLSSVKTGDNLSIDIENSAVILLDESLLVDPSVLKKEESEKNLLPDKPETIDKYLDGDGLLGPKRNTQKILIPRTKDMSRGFLTFTEDTGMTMLKEEPEDLTHLAPVAGDACVPLDEHPFLSDVLDDLLVRDFSPLIMDEPMDPFISYRDTYDLSPELLSPNVSKNYDSSLPSLNSPSNSLGEDDHIGSFMNYSMEEDKSESSIRPVSPYIPMNMDELPLLLSSSNDLMWSNSSSPIPQSPTSKTTKDSSSLARLLSSSVSSSSGKKILPSSMVGKSVRSGNSATYNNKRTNSSSSNVSSKRIKIEQPKEKLSSELLQQLIANSNNNSRSRPKKTNWLLEGQKAACISQPSDSVLMNLLDNISGTVVEKKIIIPHASGSNLHRYLIRVNSKSLLNTEAGPISSLLTLTDKDYEVNAPVNSHLLQGEDLIKALDICDSM